MGRDAGEGSERDQPGRKRRPPLVTPDQAIVAAYGLVEREGPEGLSMRKLAAALHVSLPTVYTAIDSREALVGELQERVLGELGALLGLGRRTRPPGSSRAEPGATGAAQGEAEPPPVPAPAPPSTLEEMADVVLGWAAEHERLAEFLVVEPVSGAVAGRLLRTADAGQRERAARLVADLAGGPPGEDFDPVGALTYVVAQARATLYLARDPALSSIDAARWARIGCRNVIEGLRDLAGRPATTRTV